MPGAAETGVSAQGQMNLPEDVLSRWGLEKGGVVTLVDLGEAVLVAPGGLEDLRRRLLQPVAEVDDNVRLHGHGVRAEVGNAFLKPVIELLEEDSLPTSEAVEAVLRTPIAGVGRYRFPNKAAYISGAVARIAAEPPPEEPSRRVDYLLRLRGVGPKTAALIESGLTGLHAEVHINDIWLRRALTPAGVFRSDWDVAQHYDRFEAAFLQYARHGNVLPGALDWCIWDLARKAGSRAFTQPG